MDDTPSTPGHDSTEEQTPTPTPSPIPVPQLSNPSLRDHPPIPKFNAPHPTSSYPSLRSKIDNTTAIPTQLNESLVKEMSENVLHTTANFLERLLPRERLPLPVNEELLTKLSTPIGEKLPIWNRPRSCFYRPPMIAFGETAVCEWLNNIGMTIGVVYGRPCERLWWMGRCRAPLVPNPSSIPQKPDLILLDRDYYNKLSKKVFPDTLAEWPFVNAVAEVYQPNDALTKPTTRSYLTFLCQGHRRFTITLSFFNPINSQFSVTVIDRVGQIRVSVIDLMCPSDENGLFFLSILAFLMFGSPEDVGLDPHFKINPLSGRICEVECENRRFQILKRIHALPKLFGRGTQVWIVAHNGIKYIMKDSWVREDRNEVEHLRRMTTHNKLQGLVPTLICGGDVVISGCKDSTQRYRSAPYTHRIHRRIVTSPIGESIASFKTKKEFIRVMITVIETHRYLCNHLGILHCDLSLGNILLNRKDNESEAIGLLIDYDYSVDIEAANHQDPHHTVTQECAPDASSDMRAADDNGHFAAGRVPAASEPSRPTPRTGTLPFLSIEALLASNPFVHQPKHDLESILYIILYICTYFRGPGQRLELDATNCTSPPIGSWSGNGDTREIAYRKVAHLACYDIAIIPYFTPYWCDFAPFVKDLIIACFPLNTSRPNNFQYDQALQILNKAYDSVGEPQADHVSPVRLAANTLKRPGESLDQDSKNLKERRLV